MVWRAQGVLREGGLQDCKGGCCREKRVVQEELSSSSRKVGLTVLSPRGSASHQSSELQGSRRVWGPRRR